MFITRQAEWYRPYYVAASNSNYRVEKIHFYKDNKILVSSNSGWLEKIDGDINSIELPIDEIKRRNKEIFDGKVFVISKGKERYTDDLLAEIYIPADMLDIHFVEYKIEYNTQVRAIYKGANDIYISTYVKSIDGKLQELRKQYDEIYEACKGYNFIYHTEQVIEQLDNLKNLAKQYIEEKQRVENLTINDIEL